MSSTETNLASDTPDSYQYFDIKNIGKSDGDILIHGPRQCGKSVLIKNIFPYIAGSNYSGSPPHTSKRVLLVASDQNQVEEYRKLTTHEKKILVVSDGDYSRVLKYAKSHIKHMDQISDDDNWEKLNPLLIIIENFVATKKSMSQLKLLFQIKARKIRLLISTQENDSKFQTIYEKISSHLIGFRYKFMANNSCQNTFTVTDENQLIPGYNYLTYVSIFRPWLVTWPLNIKLLLPVEIDPEFEKPEVSIFEHMGHPEYVAHLENMSRFAV